MIPVLQACNTQRRPSCKARSATRRHCRIPPAHGDVGLQDRHAYGRETLEVREIAFLLTGGDRHGHRLSENSVLLKLVRGEGFFDPVGP